MSCATKPYVREYKVVPAVLDMNAEVAANGVPVTSAWFDVTGYNQIEVVTEVDWTAATRMDFYLEEERPSGLANSRLQTSVIATGVETLSDHEVRKAVSADKVYSYIRSISYTGRMRIVYTSVGGTTDTVTCTIYLRVSE
jgi:hypothetical protein